jgi:hypothetical protein
MQRNPTKVTVSRLPFAGGLADSGDRIGLVGSLLCALHCALFPLLIALVPTLGLSGASVVDFDQAFTVFATLLGVTMLGLGYRRHRAFQAWVALLPGLALVWWGSFSGMHTHSVEHVLVMVCGGLAIAAAHLINLRLSHRAALRPLAAQSA